MLEAKFFTMMIAVTLLISAAIVALQVLEMQAYSLF
jgi:hypothetical protein